MRTSKPISTISYNSIDFLRDKIDYWKRCGLIEFGMWITHKPEADEKKTHHHVFLKPSKMLQTMDLETDSCEIDPLFPDKPLKMISFRNSNESDWILYGIHESTYLLEKGLSRQYSYDISDIEATCYDTLADILSHLNDNRKGKLETRIVDCVRNGMSWTEIIQSGLIPIRHIVGARHFYLAITGQDKNIV